MLIETRDDTHILYDGKAVSHLQIHAPNGMDMDPTEFYVRFEDESERQLDTQEFDRLLMLGVEVR
jgi:hypothetical protein